MPSDIEYTNIDAAIYLDYSAGIEAGIYKWILSENGDHYTLAYIDDTGESKINVGANNEESIDNGKNGAKGGMTPLLSSITASRMAPSSPWNARKACLLKRRMC